MSTGYSRSVSRRDIGIHLVRSRNKRVQQLYSDAFGKPTRMVAQSYAGRILASGLRVGVVATYQALQIAREGGEFIESAVGEAGKWRDGRTRTSYALSLLRGSRRRKSRYDLPY